VPAIVDFIVELRQLRPEESLDGLDRQLVKTVRPDLRIAERRLQRQPVEQRGQQQSHLAGIMGRFKLPGRLSFPDVPGDLLPPAIIEPAAFIMTRKMLLGIRQRAEALCRDMSRRSAHSLSGVAPTTWRAT